MRFFLIFLMCVIALMGLQHRGFAKSLEGKVGRTENSSQRGVSPIWGDSEPLWLVNLKYTHDFTKKRFLESVFLFQDQVAQTGSFFQLGYTADNALTVPFCSALFLTSVRFGVKLAGKGFARESLEGEPECYLSQGLGFALLAKFSDFVDDKAWLLRPRAEIYVADYRFAYTLFWNHSRVYKTELVHQTTASWYFAERQKAEVFYARGHTEGVSLWNWGLLLEWLIEQQGTAEKPSPMIGLFDYGNKVIRGAVQHSFALGLRYEF